jgi:hypothetical protein
VRAGAFVKTNKKKKGYGRTREDVVVSPFPVPLLPSSFLLFRLSCFSFLLLCAGAYVFAFFLPPPLPQKSGKQNNIFPLSFSLPPFFFISRDDATLCFSVISNDCYFPFFAVFALFSCFKIKNVWTAKTVFAQTRTGEKRRMLFVVLIAGRHFFSVSSLLFSLTELLWLRGGESPHLLSEDSR